MYPGTMYPEQREWYERGRRDANEAIEKLRAELAAKNAELQSVRTALGERKPDDTPLAERILGMAVYIRELTNAVDAMTKERDELKQGLLDYRRELATLRPDMEEEREYTLTLEAKLAEMTTRAEEAEAILRWHLNDESTDAEDEVMHRRWSEWSERDRARAAAKEEE